MHRSLPSIAAALALLAGIVSAVTTAEAALPRAPRHVIVIVEENKSYAQIVGNRHAPYINMLATRGALFTNAHGVTHPSLPNYLSLFAGVANDNGDGCPATGISPNAPNIGSELIAAKRSFAGYSESLPASGSTICAAGSYGRKHAPWVAFSNVPRSDNRTFAELPTDYAHLPTLAFVIPNVDDDMHDGTIAAGDDWLAKHLAPLLSWADRNDTLVVLTWDEGLDADNTVATVFYGPMVKPGRYSERVSHLNVLRTLEDLYGLEHTGAAGGVATIADCWR